MNQNGNVMTAFIGGILFIMGIFMMLVLWSPIYALAVQFINEETMFMGSTIVFFIQLVPIITCLVGVILIASEAFGGRYPY